MTCAHSPCKCYERLGSDFWFLPTGRCLYEDEPYAPKTSDSGPGQRVEASADAGRGPQERNETKMTPERIREIFAEELRKNGESVLAQYVLEGREVVNMISWSAVKAMQRIADESPKKAVFDALMNRLDNRLDEVREQPQPVREQPQPSDVPVSVKELS
jgi:hypothetical protein